MISDRDLDRALEQEAAGESVDLKALPTRRFVIVDDPVLSRVGTLPNPPRASSPALIGLAAAGLALWASRVLARASSPGLVGLAVFGLGLWILRVLEREREDRIDVEEARKALAEEGSISLAELKAELGL